MDLPAGFRFGGVYSGVKKNPNKKDLTLLVSDAPASAVGMFTTNRVCAAPVQVTRSRLPAWDVRGIVVNSGNANACTGEEGLANANEMTERVAAKLGCQPSQVLVCSTGVIGRPMPMEKIRAGIDEVAGAVSHDAESFLAAAHGILTTDTRTKIATRTLKVDGSTVRIAGFAKGAAMIGPNMATMLAFVLTDAVAPPELLGPVLRQSVDKSFHSISVEGHTSTNDTVLLLANGASGVNVAQSHAEFATLVEEVCIELAIGLIDDAEECTHVVTIDVTGTRTEEEARQIAKAVADSPLVKTAMYGNDPNWGRICSAAGYAGVPFAEQDLSLRVNGTLLYDRGVPTNFDAKVESGRLKDNRDVHVELILTLGDAKCRFWTSDLSVGYVRFNAEYTT